VVDTIEALRRSHEAGLDLVEVAPDSAPPVCRILDFGKYKYELAKKEKANKAKSKTAEMKEVRLGRSMKIDPHDVSIRVDQARRFLMEGHKVQIVQNFRGRELMHRDRGDQRMREIIEKLADISRVETPPRLAGRRMSVILAPDKPKVDAILRKLAKQQPRPATDGQTQAHQEPPASPPPDDSAPGTPTPSSSDAKGKAAGKLKASGQSPSKSRKTALVIGGIEEPAELKSR
jgi:translation initiation factor IF-3